jgi:adenosylhomocysteine nucleosidase
MTSSGICIVGAMDEEIEGFLSHGRILKTHEHAFFCVYEASLFDLPVTIVKCGVGKVFAALITQHVIDTFRPRAVVSTGVAGAVSKNLRIGDVIVSQDCVQHDMDVRALGFERGRIPFTDFRFFPADENLRRLALSATLESPDHTVVSGRILTGDQFMSGIGEESYRFLTQELKGDAVDMESAAIAQVCFINEIPFVSVRTISDYANSTAHIDFNAFLPVIVHNSFRIVKQILLSHSR